MKKLILPFVVFCNLINAQGIPQDKILHFETGALVGGLSYEIFYTIKKDRKQALLYSIITSIIVCAGKELYDDSRPGDYPSGKDFTAGMLGAVGAGVTLNLFDRYHEKRGQQITILNR